VTYTYEVANEGEVLALPDGTSTHYVRQQKLGRPNREDNDFNTEPSP
jgi:hypothetical protein